MLYVGEVINASLYPNAALLRSHKYIEPYVGAAFKCNQCARIFVDEKTLEVHKHRDHVQSGIIPALIPVVEPSGLDELVSSLTSPEDSAGLLEDGV
jgi:hypothetical protein